MLDWLTSVLAQVGTYGGKYKREGPAKGDKSYGGYANYHRAPSHFVMKIPDGLDPAMAAPFVLSHLSEACLSQLTPLTFS